jgi:hypothetical protein
MPLAGFPPVFDKIADHARDSRGDRGLHGLRAIDQEPRLGSRRRGMGLGP